MVIGWVLSRQVFSTPTDGTFEGVLRDLLVSFEGTTGIREGGTGLASMSTSTTSSGELSLLGGGDERPVLLSGDEAGRPYAGRFRAGRLASEVAEPRLEAEDERCRFCIGTARRGAAGGGDCLSAVISGMGSLVAPRFTPRVDALVTEEDANAVLLDDVWLAGTATSGTGDGALILILTGSGLISI